MPTRRRTFPDFTLTVGGSQKPVTRASFPKIAEAIFQAGRNDATPARDGGRILVSFSRKSQSLASAVSSAIRDIHRLGLTILNVDVENDLAPKDRDSLISP